MRYSDFRFRPGEEVLAKTSKTWRPAVVVLVFFNCYVVSPAPGKVFCVAHDENWIRPAPSPPAGPPLGNGRTT